MKTYLRRMRATDKCPARKPLKQIMWSWVGAFLGIEFVALLGKYMELTSTTGSIFLIGSFGASAILVYGAPMAEFSQPRNLLGGHFVSALVGITVFMIFGATSILAGAIAVSFALVAMHFTRTLHPPGGASALIAVIGGEKVHALGYMYALCPVLAGTVILLAIALIVNNLPSNPNRHYPVYWL